MTNGVTKLRKGLQIMNADIIIMLIVSVAFCGSMIGVYWFGFDLFVDFCKECNEERESNNAALADLKQSEMKSDDGQYSLTIPNQDTLNTIKCEYCGSLVSLTETNCPNCGAVLPEQEEAEYVELYADDEIIERVKINPLDCIQCAKPMTQERYQV